MSCQDEKKFFDSPYWEKRLETLGNVFESFYSAFDSSMEEVVKVSEVFDPVAISLDFIAVEEELYPIMEKYSIGNLVAMWIPMMNLWHRVNHIEKKVVVAENDYVTTEQAILFCENNWKALEELRANTGVDTPTKMALILSYYVAKEMDVIEPEAMDIMTRHLLYPVCRLYMKLKEIDKGDIK